MRKISDILSEFGEITLLLLHSLRYLPSLPRQFGRVIEQCYLIGYATFPIVAILSFFIGAVLALQTGYSLTTFGATDFLGTIVGLSIARELGPVMASILLAGRVGSAITAELASMKVYQEVDALITMNIPPEKILVLPRIIAILLTMPVLGIIAILVGWLGGAFVANNVAFIYLDSRIYFQGITQYVAVKDVMDGLIKAQVFGFFVILISCHVGLRTTGGPREIGNSVTRAVVLSLISILILDYFVTQALL